MAEIHQSPETEKKERDDIDALSEGNMEKLHESDDPDTYEVAGGKYSLHGVVYQRKLLMLFALRSINKHKKFKLATEMKMADKLDDVILMYPKIDGTGNLYRFLQAKHRSGEVNDMRKISAADLLKETDGDFSIPTYFRSYLNILSNHEFSGKCGEIHDIVICSNAGLWLGNSCGDFVLTEDIFEGVDEEDFIFGNSLKKLKKEFRGREKVEFLLLNCFSKFPERFANTVVNSKPYYHKEKEFQDKATYFDNLYEIAFIEEVVDLSSKKFRCGFVEGRNLSGTANHFRQFLGSEWGRWNEPEKFQDWLRSVVLDITGITGDHGLKAKSVAKKISEAVRKNVKEKIIYGNDKESVIYKNMEKLTLLGMFESREGEFRFSRRFLDSERLSEIVLAIRTELLKHLEIMRIQKEWYGEKSISTLQLRLLYSLSLYESHSRKKALEILNQILLDLNLTDIKVDTLQQLSQNELIADVLREFGMNEEEKFFHIKSLEALEKLLGKQRPRTLLTMSKLAIAECKLGNDQDARKLLEDIERNLSNVQNHADYIELNSLVIELLSRLKDFKKCIKRMDEFLKRRDESGNLIQSNLLGILINTAAQIGENGEFEECLKLLTDIKTRQSLSLGSEHRVTLRTTREIIKVLHNKNDFKNALKECKKLLYIQSNAFGEEDVDTLRTKVVLAQILASTGQYAEALESLNLCHSLMCDKLGEDIKETLFVKHWIGFILYSTGEMEQGKLYLFEVYRKLKTLFGENDKVTATTKMSLEKILRSKINK